ncbi:MAG: CDC27 family protein [Candidatus Sumerlaeia bacterium]|nr:CDC27 family protein [Candidatus Sumerlaeia bacterium]
MILAALLLLNALLIAAWIFAALDCARRQRSYAWLAATALAPLLLYLPALAYIANFVLLPLAGRRPVDDALAGAKRRGELAARAAERGLPADLEALAQHLADEQEWTAALEALKRLLDQDGENQKAHHLAALCLVRLGKPQAALPHLEYLVEENESFQGGSALVLLGEALGAAGHHARAEEPLRRAFERHRRVDAAVLLAELLVFQGREADARAVVEDLRERLAGSLIPVGGGEAPWVRRAEQLARKLGVA